MCSNGMGEKKQQISIKKSKAILQIAELCRCQISSIHQHLMKWILKGRSSNGKGKKYPISLAIKIFTIAQTV